MKDIFAVRIPEGWKVLGSTFDYKETIKRAGGRWNGLDKTWEFHTPDLPATIVSIATVLTEGQPGATQVIEKTIEVEVERVIEKPVLVNKAKPNRARMTTSKRSIARKPRVTRIEAEPKGKGFVKPSYWTDLCMYLTKGAARPVVALVGPAGNGKTSTAKAAMEAMGHEYLEIDCTEFTEPADLIGGMLIKAENGGTSSVWGDGTVTRAFKQGLGLVVNEYDALNPRAALCLQSVFQDGGRDGASRYVTTVGCPDHDRVFAAGDCPIILSLNTYGMGGSRQYVGRNTMDAAGMDRLTIITTGYENEAAILEAHGYSSALAEKLERWATNVRQVIEGNTLKVILSNRTLIRMAQAMETYGWAWRKAVENEFLGRFEPSIRSVLEDAAYKEPATRLRRTSPAIEKAIAQALDSSSIAESIVN